MWKIKIHFTVDLDLICCFSILHFMLKVAPWCSHYHYCTVSFNKVWTQVLRNFESCSWHVKVLQWWKPLTLVPAGKKAYRLSSVNHSHKTIHHHHYRHSDGNVYRRHLKTKKILVCKSSFSFSQFHKTVRMCFVKNIFLKFFSTFTGMFLHLSLF